MSTRTDFPDDAAIEVLIDTLEIIDSGLSHLAHALENGDLKTAELKVRTLKFIIRHNMVDFLGIKDEESADDDA